MANFDTLNVVFGLLKMHVKNKFKEKVMGFIFSMCRELYHIYFQNFIFFPLFLRKSKEGTNHQSLSIQFMTSSQCGSNISTRSSCCSTVARVQPGSCLQQHQENNRGDNDLSHTQLNVEKELALVGSYHDIIVQVEKIIELLLLLTCLNFHYNVDFSELECFSVPFKSSMCKLLTKITKLTPEQGFKVQR